MKQFLRENLGMREGQEDLLTQFKRLEQEMEKLKAGYKKLTENRKKLLPHRDAGKNPRSKRTG